MKKYIANTAISISVAFPNGTTSRISFSPLSNGKSVYYTDDSDIQWALEHHYKFGKLFRLELTDEQSSIGNKKRSGLKSPPKKPSSGKKTKEPAVKEDITAVKNDSTEDPEDEIEDIPSGAETEDESQEEDVAEYREVTVSDMDAAKDYLAEYHDVVRTKLKKEDDIRAAALSFGIIFKYL